MSLQHKPSTKKLARHRLTPRQVRFIEEYLIDLNQRRAAIRAGYSRKHVDSTASALMRHPPVARELKRRMEKRAAKSTVTAEQVIERLAQIGLQDVRELYDRDGNPRPIDTLNDAVAPMVAGYEVVLKNAAAGDGIIDRVLKVRHWDPTKALEILAKHLGVLVDHVKLDVHGKLQLVDERAPDSELIARLEVLLAKAKTPDKAAA